MKNPLAVALAFLDGFALAGCAVVPAWEPEAALTTDNTFTNWANWFRIPSQ